MADKFINGLQIYTSDGANVGLALSRVIVEWCTQVIGMTLWDSSVTGGGSWTAVIASGADGASVVGEPAQLSIPSRAWTPSDRGRYITVTGMTDPSKNGIYRVWRIISSSVIEVDIRYGVHDSGIPAGQSGLSWRLINLSDPAYRPTFAANNYVVLRTTYSAGNMDFSVNPGSAGSAEYPPNHTVSPWGDWNNVTHGWSTAKIFAKATSVQMGTHIHLFGCGDLHRVILGWYSRAYTNYGFIYIGEFTPSYPASDGHPALLWCGGQSYNTPDYPLGQGRATGSETIGQGLRFLSSDDATVISGVIEIPTMISKDDATINKLKGWYRRWSSWNKSLHRLELIATSLTAGRFERRGVMKEVWGTAQMYNNPMAFGASKEFLHFGYGLSFPWNGSAVHSEFGR